MAEYGDHGPGTEEVARLSEQLADLRDVVMSTSRVLDGVDAYTHAKDEPDSEKELMTIEAQLNWLGREIVCIAGLMRKIRERLVTVSERI